MDNLEKEEEKIRKGRVLAENRLRMLIEGDFLELGIFAADGMYEEWGGAPSAGVITGIGTVSGRKCMVIINDSSVKAGAMFPQSVKKVLRAQNIAYACKLPVLYLVDSAGVFLPLQDEIFPDEDDFGRIFRNNAIFSSKGIPQFAVILGNCIAGGGYLPVLSDQLIMKEGAGLYLAGPKLVKAAIGQVVDKEELGGAKMHMEISGTVDYVEKDDGSCIERLKRVVGALPEDQTLKKDFEDPVFPKLKENYDARDLIQGIVDPGSFSEFKSDYGKSLVTAFAKIHGMPVGILANQKIQTETGKGEIQLGGVLYPSSADKGARFIMDCNQMKIPLLFIQDVMGFMVGKEAEEAGIIRSGAKMVNALSNSVVPKITVIVGGSFGAGNYVMCGKAYDPTFIVAWPNAKYAVMGPYQASQAIQKEELAEKYEKQMDIRYGAARGWVDAIIPPKNTRKIVGEMLGLISRNPYGGKQFNPGVIQV